MARVAGGRREVAMARRELSSHGLPKAAEDAGERAGGVWSREHWRLEQRLRGVLRGRQRLVTFVIQMGGDGPAKIKMGNAENIMGPGLEDIGPESMLTEQ